MNSRDSRSNCNISAVDTDRGGSGGEGIGGGPGRGIRFGGVGRSLGRGGHGVPPKDAVGACIHITKSYYCADQYIKFSAAEKHKFFQSKVKQPREVGDNMSDTSSIKELRVDSINACSK